MSQVLLVTFMTSALSESE